MSLIACKDKKRMHRVIASSALSREDYYCPNIKCNAVLRLVDCDDAVKKDHFRVKQGYSHIDRYPYIDDSRYLVLNNFTNSEIKELENIIEQCKLNIEDFVIVSSKIKKLSSYVSTFKVEKFKFYNKNNEFTIGYCLPFRSARILLSNLFFNLKSDVEKQGVILHEATHQALWLNDRGKYGDTARNNKSVFKKREMPITGVDVLKRF